MPTPQHPITLEEYGTVFTITSGNRDQRIVSLPGSPESSNIRLIYFILHEQFLTILRRIASRLRLTTVC